MKRPPHIIRRFFLIVFVVLTAMASLFMFITYAGIKEYHQASTQLLNKDVAAHIAKFTSPFAVRGFDAKKADSVFYNAMVLSPSVEVYFLDTSGHIVAYHKDSKPIQKWDVPILPLHDYIRTEGLKYMLNTDPRSAGETKIFTVSAVTDKSGPRGFIYVILGSAESEGIISVLFGSHLLRVLIETGAVITILSLVIIFWYMRRVGVNLRQMDRVLVQFENGDYSARFPDKQSAETAPVAHAFNKMAGQLSQTIERLSGSEAERKRFMANISHDLRTPLAIARGYTETLLSPGSLGMPDEQTTREYLALLHRKILQMDYLVQQLLELSKMESAKFTVNKEPFVLSEILQEQINTFAHLAKEKTISIKCVECIDHIWVNADPGMIERVIQNLLDNALKSTPENGVISAFLKKTGERLVCRIENPGLPINDAIVSWINKTADAGEGERIEPSGLGLGLLIVQRILTYHNATLHVERCGDCNCFSFALAVYTA